MKTQRTVSYLLAFGMLAMLFSGVVPITTNAAALVDGEFVYTIGGSPTVATVTNYTGTGGALNIPATLGGYTVMYIGTGAFFHSDTITSITIPDSVVTICAYAFYYCNAMTVLTIGNNVTNIGQWAFAYCLSLPIVTIPDSVTTLGQYSFCMCQSMTSANLGTGITTIDYEAFGHCESLTSIYFYGLVAPTGVGANWMIEASTSLRGHAYADSDFPTPGNIWNGLIMGTLIPESWAPKYNGTTIISYEMSYGATYDQNTYPIVSELNATYDLYDVEFDTWTNVTNVHIQHDIDWIYLSSTPHSSSVTSIGNITNITGVANGVTYRVYFAVPIVRMTDTYFSIWTSSTGEGVPFETFHLRYCSGNVFNDSKAFDILNPMIELEYGRNWSVAIMDYFGNIVSVEQFSTMAKVDYVSMSIDVHSVKIFNQRDDFVKVRVYYNNSGTPISYFAAPMEPVERFLRTGNYSFSMIFYTNATAGATQNWTMHINDTEFLKLSGNTISRVISDIAGVYALQTIITNVLAPNVVGIMENMPTIPNDYTDPDCILVHPYSIVTGYDNGTKFTNSTVFYFSYYLSQKLYQKTLTVNNNGTTDWANVTWFVGFPDNRSIDYSTVKIYDVNNGVYLESGKNYDMTLSGMRMQFAFMNASMSRTFKFSFYDANASTVMGMPIAYADTYTSTTYQGASMYHSVASWTNGNGAKYTGSLQIKLTGDNIDHIQTTSVIVIDKAANRQLLNTEFTVSGGVVMVTGASVVVGGVASYDVYFKLDLSQAGTPIDLYTKIPGTTIPIYAVLFAAAVFCIGMYIFTSKRHPAKGPYLMMIIVISCIGVLIWYFGNTGVM
jgi:hypothetical protein